jgi:hypothetical protein
MIFSNAMISPDSHRAKEESRSDSPVALHDNRRALAILPKFQRREKNFIVAKFGTKQASRQ